MSKYAGKNSQEQQAQAWLDICEVLDELDPDWIARPYSGIDCAIQSIRAMAKKAVDLDKYGPAAYA